MEKIDRFLRQSITRFDSTWARNLLDGWKDEVMITKRDHSSLEQWLMIHAVQKLNFVDHQMYTKRNKSSELATTSKLTQFTSEQKLSLINFSLNVWVRKSKKINFLTFKYVNAKGFYLFVSQSWEAFENQPMKGRRRTRGFCSLKRCWQPIKYMNFANVSRKSERYQNRFLAFFLRSFINLSLKHVSCIRFTCKISVSKLEQQVSLASRSFTCVAEIPLQ